ncbi:MAG: phytoene desaturase family protein [Arcticibacter sp.]
MTQSGSRRDYDAIVVGAGPNGLAAAITLRQSGLSVLLLEGKKEIGGGMRSAELTLPGFLHDVCSAVHPMAARSAFFKSIPLAEHGLRFVTPEVAAAHPFDEGHAAVLYTSIEKTAATLGKDGPAYTRLMNSVCEAWPLIAKDALGPLHFPSRPFTMAGFGIKAIPSAWNLAKMFSQKEARGLWAGMAAHAIQPLTNLSTSAIGLVLMANGHLGGWPIPLGGSVSIANAMSSYYLSLGGEIQANFQVESLDQLPSARAVLFDVTPRQLLKIAGHKFSSIYKWQMERYRYGMGIFKVDWALDAPIPFTAEVCRRAGTIHIGNTIEEIAAGEKQSSDGKIVEKPFVLMAQQSLFDPSRAPEGKHTAWAYCHVPHGSNADMTAAIENQVERFAPGFRERILAKHTMNAGEMEAYNPNYIGGDINGGIQDVRQLFTRPVLRRSPYTTSAKGIYICSSSTPPGGGVHGMCGYHAAKKALSDIFNLEAPKI